MAFIIDSSPIATSMSISISISMAMFWVGMLQRETSGYGRVEGGQNFLKGLDVVEWAEGSRIGPIRLKDGKCLEW